MKSLFNALLVSTLAASPVADAETELIDPENSEKHEKRGRITFQAFETSQYGANPGTDYPMSEIRLETPAFGPGDACESELNLEFINTKGTPFWQDPGQTGIKISNLTLTCRMTDALSLELGKFFLYGSSRFDIYPNEHPPIFVGALSREFLTNEDQIGAGIRHNWHLGENTNMESTLRLTHDDPVLNRVFFQHVPLEKSVSGAPTFFASSFLRHAWKTGQGKIGMEFTRRAGRPELEREAGMTEEPEISEGIEWNPEKARYAAETIVAIRAKITQAIAQNTYVDAVAEHAQIWNVRGNSGKNGSLTTLYGDAIHQWTPDLSAHIAGSVEKGIDNRWRKTFEAGFRYKATEHCALFASGGVTWMNGETTPGSQVGIRCGMNL